jgi:D-tyrosyl-tRNA(Tyr) deacylase
MKALVQRVTSGAVAGEGVRQAAIGRGYVVLLGVRHGDSPAEAEALARRCAALRIFDDAAGKMNLSLADVGGQALVVSQFTLYADTRRGNRPGFTDAAPPAEAEPLYRTFVRCLEDILGPGRVCTGTFRAAMEVSIVNDGPVTIMLESKETIREDLS